MTLESWPRRWVASVVAFGLWGLVSTSLKAQEGPAWKAVPDDTQERPPLEQQEQQQEEEEEKKEEDDDDATRWPRLRWRDFELRGTLLAHAGGSFLDGESEGEGEYEVDKARLSLRWRPSSWLRAELEGDAADKPYLKDAYVRLRQGAFRVRVGQFKSPVSSHELESPWDLPTSDRGLIRDVVVNAMGVAGRRPGVEVTLATRSRWDTDTTIGVFQASHTRGERIGDEAFDNLAREVSADTIKVAGRWSVSRRSLETGIFGEWRPAEPVPDEGVTRFWAAGVDFKWIDRPKRGGVRVWMDGFVGSSWQDDNAFDGVATTFLAGRMVAAWRYGGRRTRARYAEPYTMLSLVDPDTSITRDVMWEVVGGVNAGLWDCARLTLEAQHRRVGANAPLSLGLFTWGDAPPFSRTTLLVQAGASF